MERDDEIDKQLLFRDWTVIRFWGKDILKNTDECMIPFSYLHGVNMEQIIRQIYESGK